MGGLVTFFCTSVNLFAQRRRPCHIFLYVHNLIYFQIPDRGVLFWTSINTFAGRRGPRHIFRTSIISFFQFLSEGYFLMFVNSFAWCGAPITFVYVRKHIFFPNPGHGVFVGTSVNSFVGRRGHCHIFSYIHNLFFFQFLDRKCFFGRP